MSGILQAWRNNRTLWLTLIVLVLLFLIAARGMETKDWVITVLRGLSVGAIIFLVAAGFSLIFGLMDVLNMAHGTFFMIGAYAGWTVLVRPDTFIDVLVPLLLLASGFSLITICGHVIGRINVRPDIARIWPPVKLAEVTSTSAVYLRLELASVSSTDCSFGCRCYRYLARVGVAVGGSRWRRSSKLRWAQLVLFRDSRKQPR